MRSFCFLLIFGLACLDAAEQRAVFAGGCFWCMEEALEKVEGVTSVRSGYTGGTQANPSYHQVSSGSTSHVEAVEVVFDANRVSYEQLLQHFWRNVDPLSAGGQFCDRGPQYRSAIFPLNARQQALAEVSKRKLVEVDAFRE